MRKRKTTLQRHDDRGEPDESIPEQGVPSSGREDQPETDDQQATGHHEEDAQPAGTWAVPTLMRPSARADDVAAA